ncbi:unnamed protein product [Clonostachys rosea f. rosea IK726]|uniref:Uncharacterized protein n=1 Tax=Clonostachys rosea f. rosea IK726 TaxID=1349383 RepID=A0ACA9UGV0_BIOOC|nr:unnamed protein product [Clonostachys rosea f. rosea IK726]
MNAIKRYTLRSPGTAPSRVLAGHHRLLANHSQRRFQSANEALDPLSEKDVKGRTGGGKKLDASSPNAPPKPKVSNLSMPAVDKEAHLTDEQRAEVEEHNRDFDKKHDRASPAPNDQVDKGFWSGEVGRQTVKKYCLLMYYLSLMAGFGKGHLLVLSLRRPLRCAARFRYR